MLNILLPMIGSVLDRVLPGDAPEVKAKKLEIESELQKAVIQENISQLEVNKNEAASNSLFVAGWRPFVGWICGLSLAYPLVKSFADWYLVAHGMPKLPDISSEELTTILYGMLGLGGMRTFEKIKSIDTKKLK